MILPISPAYMASTASLLSLSHSRPRPVTGAGAFTAPVEVWPIRSTVHLPAGASQFKRPFLKCGGEIDDGIGLDDLVGRHFGILGRGRRLILAIMARLAVEILDARRCRPAWGRPAR